MCAHETRFTIGQERDPRFVRWRDEQAAHQHDRDLVLLDDATLDRPDAS